MKKFLCLLLILAMCTSIALAEVAFPAFSTVDTDGNEVTESIFEDYDLTAVNIWATWCVYCVEELPSFSDLKRRLPDNVNFITLCTDAASEKDLASEILRTSGANYQTLISNDEIDEFLYDQIYAFPTTLLLDHSGKLIAKPIVGVPSREDPASSYYDLIMGALPLTEG